MRVIKRAAEMARAVYEPAHPNAGFSDARAGLGANEAVWLLNEQPGSAEGWTQSGLRALIDSRLAPQASVGWHEHRGTEEFYWLLEGRLTIWLRLPDGSEQQFEMAPGDCHRCPEGGAHAAQAGEAGARFLALEMHSR